MALLVSIAFSFALWLINFHVFLRCFSFFSLLLSCTGINLFSIFILWFSFLDAGLLSALSSDRHVYIDPAWPLSQLKRKMLR